MSVKMNWPRAALLLPLFAAGLAGCQSTNGAPLPPGDPQAPCVCAQAGRDLSMNTSCQTAYQNAQICPDLSPVAFCSRFVGSVVQADVLLFNRGLSGLKIDSVDLVGDDNCSFVLKSSFTPGQIVPYMGSEALQITYHPTTTKTPDYVQLVITSSAENFGTLRIPVCGQGIPAGMPPAPDGGTCLPCNMMPRSTKPACGSLPMDGGV